jgi:hypothetical protein
VREDMEQKVATVEEVRQTQEHLKFGITQHQKKNYKEAIESFKISLKVHPEDENQISELEKKLKAGQFKLAQESIAFMGCASVHLNELVKQLSDEEKDQVPIDKNLDEAFKGWGES